MRQFRREQVGLPSVLQHYQVNSLTSLHVRRC